MVTITLPPELELILQERAQQQGTTPDLLAIDSLTRLYMPPIVLSAEANVTLAEYWADYIGTIDSSEMVPGGARMSENVGEKFAQGMVVKHQKGKL